MNNQRVVCPGCSCLCDGLSIAPDTGIPVEVSQCKVGTQWFENRLPVSKGPRLNDLSEVIELIQRSNAPLITGIGNLTTEAQQAAVKVADRYLAGIDTGWSNSGRGSMASFQRYGKVTATLGEIANRSDVVVLWFCDPETTHPRFIERFVRPAGKPKKHLIVIDDEKTASAQIADEFIELSSTDAVSYLQNLRLELQNDGTDSNLLQQLVAATYGSVFVGKPATSDAEFDVITDQWFQLVRSLNDKTRFVMGSLRGDRNGISANNILTSHCGFPDAVRFTADGPNWNGLEYSTESVVSRRECDLLIACDVGTNEPFESRLSGETKAWLKSIPVVALSDFPANKYSTVDVHVPAATPGWTEEGDFVRTDDVPIPLSALSGSVIAPVAEIFRELLAGA